MSCCCCRKKPRKQKKCKVCKERTTGRFHWRGMKMFPLCEDCLRALVYTLDNPTLEQTLEEIRIAMSR